MPIQTYAAIRRCEGTLPRDITPGGTPILIEEQEAVPYASQWRCRGCTYPDPMTALRAAMRYVRGLRPATVPVRWRTITPHGYMAVRNITLDEHIEYLPFG